MSESKKPMTKQQQSMREAHIGPRVIGGVYTSGYWGSNYRVDAIQPPTEGNGGIDWYVVTWLHDGHKGHHCTAWDHKRDKVVSQPWWVYIERQNHQDVVVGPFDTEDLANEALDGDGPHGMLVDSICEEDALDAATTQDASMVHHEVIVVTP